MIKPFKNIKKYILYTLFFIKNTCILSSENNKNLNNDNKQTKKNFNEIPMEEAFKLYKEDKLPAGSLSDINIINNQSKYPIINKINSYVNPYILYILLIVEIIHTFALFKCKTDEKKHQSQQSVKFDNITNNSNNW